MQGSQKLSVVQLMIFFSVSSSPHQICLNSEQFEVHCGTHVKEVPCKESPFSQTSLLCLKPMPPDTAQMIWTWVHIKEGHCDNLHVVSSLKI